MNANELADLIGMCGDSGYNQDAATMLRQQQAEIEALKADTIPYKDLHRVVKNVLAHPVKELDEDFDAICLENKRLQAEIDSLKDKLMLAKQSLEIVEGWIKK